MTSCALVMFCFCHIHRWPDYCRGSDTGSGKGKNNHITNETASFFTSSLNFGPRGECLVCLFFSLSSSSSKYIKRIIKVLIFLSNPFSVLLSASGLELESSCWQKIHIHGSLPGGLYPFPERQGCHGVLQTAFTLPHHHGWAQRRLEPQVWPLCCGD